MRLSLSPKSRAGATLSSLLSHAKRAGAAEAYGSETGRLPVISEERLRQSRFSQAIGRRA